jgi:hypothetical protein
MVELYLHFPILFHGIVLNELSTGAVLPNKTDEHRGNLINYLEREWTIKYLNRL